MLMSDELKFKGQVFYPCVRREAIWHINFTLLQPANNVFLSHQTSISTSQQYFSQQISINHQPQPSKQSELNFKQSKK